jgi:hypothetical protein
MINRELVRQYVLAGSTDEEIASVCNCKRHTIGDIRRIELNLPANKAPMQKRVNRDLIAKLISQGKTTKEISKIARVCEYYIRLIRINELKIKTARRNHLNACFCKHDGWILDKEVTILNDRFYCPKCGGVLRLSSRNPSKHRMSVDEKIKRVLKAKQEIAA